MLVRAFRLTDKLGNAALKSLVWLGQFALDYVGTLGAAAREFGATGIGGLFRLVGAAGAVVVGIALALLAILRTIARVLMPLVRLLFRAGGGAPSRAGGGVPFVGQRVTRLAPAAEGVGQGIMARRADELAETVILVEDPLKARNRTLSAVTVVLLVAIVALILWATAPDRNVPASLPEAVILLTTPEAQPTSFATAVPTVTPRPESLRVGGSLVYTVRENGQDDLWATVIGQPAPVRLTNHPADDRTPSWSPDGRQLAFASNRDGNWELYVLDVSTGNVNRLTYTLGFEGTPAWSPDGEWLIYEGYSEENLDIYITRVDGTQGPLRLTYDPAPDFAPVWSPGGREIAFVSWRDGSQDIYLLSLDDPDEETALNLTNTPDINEDYPAWSPNGLTIAYSALTEGLEIVYAKPVNAPEDAAAVIGRGRAPAWAPDGDSLIYAVDQGTRTFLVAGPYETASVASEAVAVDSLATDPDWTANTELRQRLDGSGLAAEASDAPYNEEISFVQNEPPYYRLVLLNGVDAPNPFLSDRVNDSFMALRQAVLDRSGQDYLGELEDAFWALNRLPEPGQERLNWHMAGRAFALNRNLIYGFPAPIEVVREDIGVHTYWRVYLRAAVQNGQLGEPLRRMPWDFTARSGGDVAAYDAGGRLRGFIPSGYYVDLTQLAADYGWAHLPADRTWRANFGGVLFWEFVKTDGLEWEAAMLELYSAGELTAFLTEPTPFPTATLAPPTATPEPEITRTPTPLPPDQQSPPEVPPPDAGSSEQQPAQAEPPSQ